MLAHNETTLSQLESYVNDGLDCCVVNPCGSGKTEIMAKFIKNHQDKDIIIFTKQVNALPYYKSKDNVFNDIKIRTYAKLAHDYRVKSLKDYKADIYVFDEAHYMGAEKCSHAISVLKTNFRPLFVGFTATPQRFKDQGTDKTIIETYFNGNCAGNYTTTELQKAGVFIEPEYILSLWDIPSEIQKRLDRIQILEIDDEQKNKLRNQLNGVLKKWKATSCPELILKQKLPAYINNNYGKILVYMTSVQDIQKFGPQLTEYIKAALPGEDVISYNYTYKDNDNGLQQFEQNDAGVKILFTINKVAETIHIDGLSVVIMLRPSVSNRVITQQFGRINNLNANEQTLIIDMVGNLDKLNTIKFIQEHYTVNHDRKHASKYISMLHVKPYLDIFATIDKFTARYDLYEYRGYRETITNLCHIFDKDLHTVMEMITTEQIDPIDALDMAPTKNFPPAAKTIDGYLPIPDITINDDQRVVAEKMLPVLTSVFHNRKITDEDLMQDAYLNMVQFISTHNVNDISNQAVYNRTIQFIRRQARDTERCKAFWDTRNIKDLNLTVPDIAEETEQHDLEEIIQKILNHNLTERERKVISARFGLTTGHAMTFDSVGRMFNVTRERIRQIEAKALRKLRHPSSAKQLQDFLPEHDC